MAAALKSRIHKHINNLERELGGYKPGGKDEDVGVVVSPRKAGELGRPAKSGADALMLVERHGDAVAATTHSNSRINLAGLYGKRAWMSEIGVIAAGVAVGTEIAISDAVGLEIALNHRLKLEARVIATQANRLTIN